MTLPEALYRAAQVRELERRAREQHGIPGATLMQRAGEAACALLRARWPRARRIAVVCGPGGNGGDGYVVARCAREAGLVPEVHALGDAPGSGDAAAMRAAAQAAGVPVAPFAAERLARADAIVDALLGSGLGREVEGPWREAIEAINRTGLPVLAVDIPSGLHADTGRTMGAAVRAHATMSFVGLKAGMFTGAGREHCGAIWFDDLGVPAEVYRDIPPLARRMTEDNLRGMLPRRARHAHKGCCGRVLVVGGDRGMPGAARLAGEAALRAGAGLVTLATHPAHAAAANTARHELLSYGVESAGDLRALLARATVAAVGPGLQQNEWGQRMFAAALEAKLPLVVDADGLNLLALDPVWRGDWVLTPHPGEAARLLGVAVAEVQADRFYAARELVASFGGVCVLKGSGTLVCTTEEETLDLCDAGNPGMAGAGQGDVLTGVIAALIAQGLSPRRAARLGVFAHARAGDEAARAGEIGLVASDLLPGIRACINRLGA